MHQFFASFIEDEKLDLGAMNDREKKEHEVLAKQLSIFTVKELYQAFIKFKKN
jgi:hypothetical protein